MTQPFRTVTGSDMRRSIKWARSVDNVVAVQVQNTLRQALRGARSLGVGERAPGAKPAAL